MERDESKEREKKKPEEDGSGMKGGERVSKVYPTKFEKTDEEKEKSPKKRMLQHIAGEKTEASTVMEQQSSPKVEKKERKSCMKVPQHLEGGASKNKTSDKQRENNSKVPRSSFGKATTSGTTSKGPPSSLGKATTSGDSKAEMHEAKKKPDNDRSGKISMSASDSKAGAKWKPDDE